jgi:uncharacterized protein YcgL (UPF0745 family)
MASPTDRLVTVYRSPREAGLYLYVAQETSLDRVPETLLKHFGKPEEAMQLHLHQDRKLARANAADVLSAIAEKGFYLQLPPPAPELS